MAGNVSLEGFGGGGASLNFKVLGGISQPANPKENTIWINTDKAITRWDFSATEPQKVSGNQNLLVYPYSQTTQTHNGVTFTDNGDGSIKANGTATGDAYFYVVAKDKLMVADGGTYTLTGCPSGGNTSTYLMRVTDNITGSYWDDTGSGRTKELSAGGVLNLYCFIRIKSGATVNNLVFKPQFEKGSTATSFVKGDATGQVWISTGTESAVAFSVTKKNPVMVYPISAKQYVSGAWVDKTAKSYQSGKWVEWGTYLYNSGDECVELTGGWTTALVTSGGITKNADHIDLTLTGTGGKCLIRTTNKVDFTKYSTLKIEIANHTGAVFAVTLNDSISTTPTVANWYNSALAKTDVSITSGVASLDISAVNKAAYLAIGGVEWSPFSVDIKKVWLE